MTGRLTNQVLRFIWEIGHETRNSAPIGSNQPSNHCHAANATYTLQS